MNQIATGLRAKIPLAAALGSMVLLVAPIAAAQETPSPAVEAIDTRVGWELHVRVNGLVGLRLGR